MRDEDQEHDDELLAAAQQRAQRFANQMRTSVLVYRSLLTLDYGVEYTLPEHAERVGERIYPNALQNSN